MEITIQINGQALPVEVSIEVYTYLDQAAHKDENLAHDSEDEVAREMASHGIQNNLSFFAFTATPKQKTLEIFGVRGADGLPYAFHVYSMRQAISVLLFNLTVDCFCKHLILGAVLLTTKKYT